MADLPPPANHVTGREPWRPGPRRRGHLGPLSWNLGDYQGYPNWIWKLGPLVRVDLDWNTDRFGLCLGVRLGTRMEGERHRINVGWCALTLDWMAPLGEPNRLYLFGPRWHWMLGLADNRHIEVTGETEDGVPVVREVTGRWELVRGQAWDKTTGWYNAKPFTWLVRNPRDKAKQNPANLTLEEARARGLTRW